MPRDRTEPQPPRLPADLDPAGTWSMTEDGEASGLLLSGDFSDQSASDVILDGCRLEDCRLIGASLRRLRLTDVVIHNADLSGADLDEVSLTRVQISDCRLSGAIFTRGRLLDVSFTNCRMDGANFAMADANRVTFDDVDLTESDFSAAKLVAARLLDCNLTRAEFTKAATSGVRFHGSDLEGLRGSQYLSGAIISSAQVLPVALGVLAALGIVIDDEPDTRGVGSKGR